MKLIHENVRINAFLSNKVLHNRTCIVYKSKHMKKHNVNNNGNNNNNNTYYYYLTIILLLIIIIVVVWEVYFTIQW